MRLAHSLHVQAWAHGSTTQYLSQSNDSKHTAQWNMTNDMMDIYYSTLFYLNTRSWTSDFLVFLYFSDFLWRILILSIIECECKRPPLKSFLQKFWHHEIRIQDKLPRPTLKRDSIHNCSIVNFSTWKDMVGSVPASYFACEQPAHQLTFYVAYL